MWRGSGNLAREKKKTNLLTYGESQKKKKISLSLLTRTKMRNPSLILRRLKEIETGGVGMGEGGRVKMDIIVKKERRSVGVRGPLTTFNVGDPDEMKAGERKPTRVKPILTGPKGNLPMKGKRL